MKNKIFWSALCILILTTISGCTTLSSLGTNAQASASHTDLSNDSISGFTDSKGRSFTGMSETGERKFVPSNNLDFLFHSKKIEQLNDRTEKAYASLTTSPKNMSDLKVIAYDQLMRENGEGAIAFLNIGGIRKIESDSEALFLMGIGKFYAGQELAGKNFLMKSLEASAGNRQQSILTLLNLGVYYGSKGLHLASIDSYSQALRLDPQNSNVKLILAGAHFKANHFPQAATLYKEVLKVDPTNANANFNLAQTYKIGMRDYKAARNLYQKMVRSAFFSEEVKIEADAAMKHLMMLEGGAKNRAEIGIF